MSIPCLNCAVEEKVHVCCGRHPETGQRVMLEIGGDTSFLACPELDKNGSCKIYRDRPAPCREFLCERFNTGFSISGQGFLEMRPSGCARDRTYDAEKGYLKSG